MRRRWGAALLAAALSVSAPAGAHEVPADPDTRRQFSTMIAMCSAEPKGCQPKPRRQPERASRGGRRARNLSSILACENRGGSYTAQNPRSSASGRYQIIDSTWAGYGGYRHAKDAPPEVQDERFRQLWDGGRGSHHWRECGG